MCRKLGPFPPSALLPHRGEWLLLFNSILPFPDLLRQTAALPLPAPPQGFTLLRAETVRTEEQDALHTLFFILIWGQKAGVAPGTQFGLCL